MARTETRSSLRAQRSARVRVPAKINLYLGVGEQRDDGFHEVVTVYQAVGLFDVVHAEPSTSLSVHLSGEGAEDLPRDQGNLAWQAASLLAERHGVAPAAQLTIEKAIPVAGGLAGGSADAAGTLVACDALWGLELSRGDLSALAGELGSDVAFSLLGGTALGTGRGEVLSPVLSTGVQFWWVLALATGGLSTPAVYAELDRQRAADPTASRALSAPDELLRAVRSGDPAELAGALHNEMQPATLTLAPHLRATLRAGTELGALVGMVSGSGPTCAFLCADEPSATGLAAALAAEGVCRTTRVASGPVPGARVT
ncbi:MAG: 4-(cytidine 5'-diphospho)-2-C-methyl-D-erythritol kinase [Jatrophihabitans sp.]